MEAAARVLDGSSGWLAARPLWQRMGLAAMAGLLAVAAMPPFGLWPVLFISYPALIWLLDGAPEGEGRFAGWRQAAATAWAFGFAFFLAGLYWIGSAFLVDADAFAWMIPFVAVILPGGLALFFSLAAVAARAVARNGAARVLALVLALAAAEWLRGHILTGFPWNAVGYAFGVSDTMAQAASLWGLYGHSLVALLIVTAPAMLAGPWIRRTRPAVGAAVALAVALPLTLWAFGTIRLAGPAPDDVPGVSLRIVQPNIPQHLKWQSNLRAMHFGTLLRMSRGDDDLAGTTHLIWPESAPPFFLADNEAARLLIADLLPPDTHLVTGAIRSEPLAEARRDGRTARYFNSVMVLDTDGEIGAVYDKAHLVPFGEYLPAQSFLESIGFEQLTRQRGGYDTGPGPATLPIPGAPDSGPLVCYEVIFPGSVAAEPRPGWLLNVTNDAWFGDSIGPRQHLHQARMRAIEEGLPVIRAANTGISAVINATGQIRSRLGINYTGVIDSPLPGRLPPTLYSQVGDLIFLALYLLLSCAFLRLIVRSATKAR